jgi:hypothetical protein
MSLAEENLDFKFLLILYNASADVLDHVGTSECKVICMPQLTTSVLQLMEQGAIRELKFHYLCHMFKT